MFLSILSQNQTYFRPNLCLYSKLARKWFLARFECICAVLSLLVCLSVLKFSFAFFESSIVFHIVFLRLNQAIRPTLSLRSETA